MVECLDVNTQNPHITPHKPHTAGLSETTKPMLIALHQMTPEGQEKPRDRTPAGPSSTTCSVVFVKLFEFSSAPVWREVNTSDTRHFSKKRESVAVDEDGNNFGAAAC